MKDAWLALSFSLLLFAGAFGVYRLGASHAAEKGEAALSRCEEEHALAVSSAVIAALEAQKRQIAASARTEQRSVENAARVDRIFNGLKEASHAQNHVDRTCRLDADGLRLWDAANAGASPSAPGDDAAAAKAGDGMPADPGTRG
ncbi:MAG: hypothetical protein FWD77_08305 [Betaproteobacteria bacterium]|nr:hypothetical protein [Betaproteobacteria bacterium]